MISRAVSLSLRLAASATAFGRRVFFVLTSLPSLRLMLNFPSCGRTIFGSFRSDQGECV